MNNAYANFVEKSPRLCEASGSSSDQPRPLYQAYVEMQEEEDRGNSAQGTLNAYLQYPYYSANKPALLETSAEEIDYGDYKLKPLHRELKRLIARLPIKVVEGRAK